MDHTQLTSCPNHMVLSVLCIVNYHLYVSIVCYLAVQSDFRYHHRDMKAVFVCQICKVMSNVIQTDVRVSVQYLNLSFFLFLLLTYLQSCNKVITHTG